MRKMWKLLVLFGTFLVAVDSARILGVFPMPSLSHQFVFRALTTELAKKGHELVVITTDPAYINSKPPYNITEIDASFTYNLMMNATKHFKFTKGILIEAESMANFECYKGMVDVIISQIKHPSVQKIVQDKNQHFDLIIVEAFYEYQLIFSHIFNAPVISLATFHGFPENYETVGTISRHPIYYPHVMRQKFGELSLLEKLVELRVEYKLLDTAWKIEAYENKILKENFGPNTPTIQELRNNVAFLLVNSNPVFCNNRPVPSNVAYVGPLHLQPLSELPQDLKSYLDNSKQGAIYVSLGTNVRSSMMEPELLNAFLKTFEALPYNILWAIENDNLKNIPKNVKTQKWFPQRDLLMHPNLKIFVTQGGLQSADEAIDAGVPLVIMPMLGDQYYNAEKFAELGIGVQLDAYTLTTESLLGGINEVLKNDRYRKNIINLREILKDNPQTPTERAIWWIEYVLRHKGAKHFRPPFTNHSWADILMLDVVAVLSLFILALITIIVLIVKFVLRLFKKGKPKKSKRS